MNAYTTALIGNIARETALDLREGYRMGRGCDELSRREPKLREWSDDDQWFDMVTEYERALSAACADTTLQRF